LEDIDKSLITGCIENKKNAQEELYKKFYGYAMGISMPYLSGEDEAMEVVNDGFMKVFNNIKQYNTELSFKGWLRKIMINTAIDFYRKNKKHMYHMDTSELEISEFRDEIIDSISVNEIVHMIQDLPPAYKLVFNLYVLEGYQHNEISEMLHISIGTSKSNLAKARSKLKLAIKSLYSN